MICEEEMVKEERFTILRVPMDRKVFEHLALHENNKDDCANYKAKRCSKKK